jgi:hypothetical protein
MSSAKDIVLKVIPSRIARDFIQKHHYSGKFVNNSQIHFGAFLEGELHGVLSFGPSLDKKKVQGLVKGTGWNEFIELNRMAFDDSLPKNSESRCISIAIKLIKKNAPHIRWIISFSDACQCGDGCIYRASGFVLTAIKTNKSIVKLPSGEIGSHTSFTTHKFARVHNNDGASLPKGSVFLPGFQLRYIYFIRKEDINNLTVPVIPFSEISKTGAGMYKGEKIDRTGAGIPGQGE